MNNIIARKINLRYLVIILPAFLITFILWYTLTEQYRRGIPVTTDLEGDNPILREQVRSATRKARIIPSADNLGYLGMVYHSSSNYEKALQCYTLAVKKNPLKWKWHYYLGYLDRELGESGKCIKEFKSVILRNRKIQIALFYTGEAYQNLGFADSAEMAFTKIVNSHDPVPGQGSTSRTYFFPLKTYAKLKLSDIYMNTGRTEKAESNLKGIITENITFGPAYRLLGNLYSLRGDSIESRNYIERANDFISTTAPVDTIIDRLTLISRSDHYFLKQIEIAHQTLNPLWADKLVSNELKYFPENKYLLSWKIRIMLGLGNVRNTLPYLQKHLELYKDDYSELTDIANLLYDNGLIPEALNYFQAARKLKEDEPEKQASLALWLYNRGMKKDALELMNEQYNKRPDNPVILAYNAYLSLLQGEKDKAKTFFSRLEQVAPKMPETGKIRSLLTDEHLKAETLILQETLAQNPKDISSLKQLANIYFRDKKWKQSFSLFSKALQNNANDPYVLGIMGRLLTICPDTTLRNIKKGSELLERAFVNYRCTPDIKLTSGRDLATAYAMLGEKAKATEMIRTTLYFAANLGKAGDYQPYFESLKKHFNIN